MSTDSIANISSGEIKRFLETDEGKKIITLIKNDSEGKLSNAVNFAAQGDMQAAKRIVEEFFSYHNPEKGDSNGK